jgi:hypothetical protein
MEAHPQTAHLERFAQGICTSSERQQVVRHLLRGCSSCSACLRDLLHLGVPRAATKRGIGQAPPVGGERAARLLQELTGMAPEHQLALVRERLQGGDLCTLLLQLSREALHTDPACTLKFAELATVVADHSKAEPGKGDMARLADLQGEAWSQYANALRLCGRLREAERAFATAGERLAGGTGAPRLRALLLRRQASLKSYQRNFRQAVRLTVDAGEIFRTLGEREELGRCLLKQGIFTGYAGRAEEALRLVFESLRLIEGDVDLACQAVQAAGHFAIDVGEPELGLKLLIENRPLFARSGRPLALLRMSWLFGELEHALNLLQPAESNLLAARRGFVKAEMAYETALVSLDLAMIYLKMERLGELAGLVKEMLPIFRSLGIKRETFASLILWKQAESKATLAQLQHIAAELKRKFHRFQN